MHTKAMIASIVSFAFLTAMAAAAGLIWWLGPGLGALVIAATLSIFLVVFFEGIRPWYLRWGAADEEVTMKMPGDDLVHDTDSATRAIGIAAEPEDVWPWLVQLGFGRAGWYSYDWIDNDFHHSARRIIPEYQHLEVGDELLQTPDIGFTVTEIDEGHSIVSVLEDGSMTTSWSLAVYPGEGGGSRLVSRWRPKWEETTVGSRVATALIDPGTFIMEQKMLREIRDRAELTALAHSA